METFIITPTEERIIKLNVGRLISVRKKLTSAWMAMDLHQGKLPIYRFLHQWENRIGWPLYVNWCAFETGFIRYEMQLIYGEALVSIDNTASTKRKSYRFFPVSREQMFFQQVVVLAGNI